jgi:hypothetical protein
LFWGSSLDPSLWARDKAENPWQQEQVAEAAHLKVARKQREIGGGQRQGLSFQAMSQ